MLKETVTSSLYLKNMRHHLRVVKDFCEEGYYYHPAASGKRRDKMLTCSGQADMMSRVEEKVKPKTSFRELYFD